jgi:phosphodiesterase/alkaline phosphatase D-like protein
VLKTLRAAARLSATQKNKEKLAQASFVRFLRVANQACQKHQQNGHPLYASIAKTSNQGFFSPVPKP